MEFWTWTSRRIHSIHFSGEIQLPLWWSYAASEYPMQCQDSSKSSTPRDQVTALSLSLNLSHMFEEPGTWRSHRICFTTTGDTLTAASHFSPAQKLPRRIRNPCCGCHSIMKACRPDCQCFTNPVCFLLQCNQWFWQSRRDRRTHLRFSDKVYKKSHEGVFNSSPNEAFSPRLWCKITSWLY